MRKVSKNVGQSLVDIAIEEYGGVEGIMSLAKDNGLAIDTTLAMVALISVNEEVESVVRKTLPILPALIEAPRVTTIVYSGQNVIDLVLQEYGSVEGIISFLKLNAIDQSVDLIPGTQIKADASAFSDKKMRQFFKDEDITINTGYPAAGAFAFRYFDDTFGDEFE